MIDNSEGNDVIENDGAMNDAIEEVAGLMTDLKTEVDAVNWGRALEIVSDAEALIGELHRYMQEKE